MGWNSWLSYGRSVTEDQVKGEADFMAANLKPFGYQYIVVDIAWYEPTATGFNDAPGCNGTIDDYGRLLPAINRFPSSAGGIGFKALADYVHSKGLKFGIHMLRGIPRQASDLNTPILGTPYHANDIVDTTNTCSWNDDMYGVDDTRPGAQEYYNSLVNLWASWGVDFVKIDDLTGDPIVTPRPYRAGELEAFRAAINQAGRPIVLSTSSGTTPVGQGSHLRKEANMFRIGADLFDVWSSLRDMFGLLHDWTTFCGSGHFPDADLLPLGKLGTGDPGSPARDTMFTVDEQYTLMTLWSIARSPLMYGGDLTQLDPFTRSLITNSEVIAVNQNSLGNHELFNQGGLYGWIANVPNSPDKYLALFNTNDSNGVDPGAVVSVNLADLGFSGSCQIRDLWQRSDLGTFAGQFAPQIKWHGAGLYRVSGANAPLPPTGLFASGGNHAVNLTWDNTTGATSYAVSRSVTSGGPYTIVANAIPAPNPTPAPTPTAVVNDNTTGSGLNQWDYSSGGWSYYASQAIAYQHDEHYAFAPNVTAHFRFHGTQVKVYTIKEPVDGVIGYSLDGAPEVAVDNYAPATAAALSWTSPEVSSADHDLVIRVTGTLASGSSYTIVMDKAEVYDTGLAAPQPTPTYTDSGLANGSNYYYVVSALTSAGQSANSTEAAAAPLGNSPAGWKTVDIGFPANAGGAGSADAIHYLLGGGDDIWNKTDSFRFYWQPMIGDGTFIARVRSVEHADDFTKAGIMFRQSGTPGALFAHVFATPGGNVAFQYRDNSDDFANSAFLATDTDPMRWLKLVRKGSQFYGFYSSDGAAWQSAQNIPIPMSQTALVGLAVTAHNTNAAAIAAFDFVTSIPASAVPNDGTLHLLQWLRSGPDVFLATTSQSGKTYQLQKRSSLQQSWVNTGSTQIGTGDILTFTDPNGADGNSGFYRVTEVSQSNVTRPVSRQDRSGKTVIRSPGARN